ncbi:ectoine synthase [Rhizobium sp. 25PS6]|uniref:ectoine synthase n=1 Tax=Rhizobium TaxID=379 RepID=UPI0028A6DC6C|nr:MULTISPECIES: ectoine synthase [Rhizobium]MDU0364070.1 ectoine synthase [Rhizobium sp. 25PS6]
MLKSWNIGHRSGSGAFWPALRNHSFQPSDGFVVQQIGAGSEALLQYRNHLEACYCIKGEGEVEDMDGNVFPIRAGDIYVLDKHDRHYLRGGKDQDLILVSIFNPPLTGTERHDLNNKSGSQY